MSILILPGAQAFRAFCIRYRPGICLGPEFSSIQISPRARLFELSVYAPDHEPAQILKIRVYRPSNQIQDSQFLPALGHKKSPSWGLRLHFHLGTDLVPGRSQFFIIYTFFQSALGWASYLIRIGFRFWALVFRNRLLARRVEISWNSTNFFTISCKFSTEVFFSGL